MNNGQSINSPESILVIGGGISGITAAVEAAEVGYDVCLIEKNPYLGGRVIRANQYFPKLCSPYCGLEINFKRIKTNPRIKIFMWCPRFWDAPLAVGALAWAWTRERGSCTPPRHR